MKRTKSAPAPLPIPDDLTPAQLAMIEGATSVTARNVLLSLFEKARAQAANR